MISLRQVTLLKPKIVKITILTVHIPPYNVRALFPPSLQGQLLNSTLCKCVLSLSVMSNSLRPHVLQPTRPLSMGILQIIILECSLYSPLISSYHTQYNRIFYSPLSSHSPFRYWLRYQLLRRGLSEFSISVRSLIISSYLISFNTLSPTNYTLISRRN